MILVHVQKMYNIFRILIGVPDYSSSFLFCFSKNEEEAIPPGGKKCLGTTKASTRMILVHVQKMNNIFRILIGVPDYSSSFFFMKRKLSPPPLRPSSKLGSWGTNKIYYIGIPIQQVKKIK